MSQHGENSPARKLHSPTRNDQTHSLARKLQNTLPSTQIIKLTVQHAVYEPHYTTRPVIISVGCALRKAANFGFEQTIIICRGILVALTILIV